MFRALPRPSSGAYNYISSLRFYRGIVVVAALLVVVWPVITCQTTTNNATHKRQVINLWNCCIWLVNSYESSLPVWSSSEICVHTKGTLIQLAILIPSHFYFTLVTEFFLTRTLHACRRTLMHIRFILKKHTHVQ